MRQIQNALRCLVCTAILAVNSAVAAPERPVLFIPGILGSKLCDGQQIVWGTAISLPRFANLQLSPSSSNSITPCGLVEKISLLGPFWSIHQYDGLITTLHDLGYAEGTTEFVFPYDWRQSNFDSAKALRNFIDGTAQLRSGNFDIVAHSMGGIVARIYLQQLGGDQKVHKIIFLGTPFWGSMNAIATLSDGWGAFANQLAGGLDTIRETILSFPAFYELFPSYDGCCRLGSEADFTKLDIFNFDVWLRYGWLPQKYATGAGAVAARKNLQRAATLRDLLHQKLISPPHVTAAGDAFATRFYLYASKDNPGWRNWRFSKSRGDGTVPVWSAASNLQSLSGTSPSFSEHATIFDDDTIRNVLIRELVSNIPPAVTATEHVFEVTTTAGLKSIRLIDLDVEPKVAKPNEVVHLSIAVDFIQPIQRGELIPTANLISSTGPVALKVLETTTDADLSNQRLSFGADLTAPREEGAWRLDVLFPGQGTHATYLETWSHP